MTTDFGDIYGVAIELFKAGNVLEASALIDAAIAAAPTSNDGLHLRLIRARAIENGDYAGGSDFQRAYVEYRSLEPWVAILGVEVLVGGARALFLDNPKKHLEEITRLLTVANEIKESPHAHMIYGATLQEVGKPKLARKHFMRAFRLGLPWGMRYFATSHLSERHYLRAFVCHFLATLVSPFLVWRFGLRGPFRERNGVNRRDG